MKAVVLAGGEGTRLRPLSIYTPKPMVTFMGKPVLEHTIAHLQRHGITQVITTLQTLPHVVTDYFGNGASWGIPMTHNIETTPLGTAGAVKGCVAQLGDEPFVVISGDGVCDFDLRAALQFHTDNDAAVTVVLHKATDLRAYGLVMTEPTGRITRFIEKPSWGQVFCDTVNTGIYIINPRVLSQIPEGTSYDFAKDLFPQMLATGQALYGYVASGYWCDIGDTNAYLQCAFDVLDGKLHLALVSPRMGQGVWAASPIPDSVQIIPPCYIGAGVTISAGARIGPYAIIDDATDVGAEAIVERSYLQGVTVGAKAEVSGAIVCRGTRIGVGATLREGSVIGEGVQIGAYAQLQDNTRIWPNKEIEAGARVSGSIATGAQRRTAVFDGQGSMEGQPNVDLTPDFVLRLGAAVGAVSKGDVSISWQGGDAARMLSFVLEAGVTAAGRAVVRQDTTFPAAAAFVASVYHFDTTIFVSQWGETIKLHFYGSDGLPIERGIEQKLEAVVARGEVTYREARAVGASQHITGMNALYEMAAGELPEWYTPKSTVSVGVEGGGASQQALYHSLLTTPCQVHSGGRPLFRIDPQGFTVSAIDETERDIPHARLLAILCLFEANHGNATLAVPYAAPAQLDSMSHVNIRRVGRDADARKLLASQPYMRDGLFLLTRITAALATTGQTLSALNDALPPFVLHSIEIPLQNDRGAVMRALADSCDTAELVEGIRTPLRDGWVHVTPLAGRRALRITAEGATVEIATELCFDFRARALTADRTFLFGEKEK